MTLKRVVENVSLIMNQEKITRLDNWLHSYEPYWGSTVIEVKWAEIGRLAPSPCPVLLYSSCPWIVRQMVI
jgi:hypothetical protein